LLLGDGPRQQRFLRFEKDGGKERKNERETQRNRETENQIKRKRGKEGKRE
jgi:hypothetical protein